MTFAPDLRSMRRSAMVALTTMLACAPASSSSPAVVVPDPDPYLVTAPAAIADSLVVASPDGENVVVVATDGEGHLTYRVQRHGRNVIMPSRLGFAFRGATALDDSLRITDGARRSRRCGTA